MTCPDRILPFIQCILGQRDSSLPQHCTLQFKLFKKLYGLMSLIYRLTVLRAFQCDVILTISVQRMLFQFRVNQGENENLTGLYYLYTDPAFFTLRSALCPHYAHTKTHTSTLRQSHTISYSHAIRYIADRIFYHTSIIVYPCYVCRYHVKTISDISPCHELQPCFELCDNTFFR